MAAELFNDGADFAGGDALDIHFGQGELQGLFTAQSLVQGAGIELDVTANLWDFELHFAHAGVDGFGFEPVGVSLARGSAFVGLGSKSFGSLADHRFIEEDTEAFEEAIEAGVVELLQDVVQEFRVVLVGHTGVLMCLVAPQQQT